VDGGDLRFELTGNWTRWRDAALRGGATTAAANATASAYANGIAPSDFYDGSFKFTQFVGTLDLKKEFDIGLSDPLNLAFGAQYRRESYSLGQGDAPSLYVEGGQSFPGYSASDAGTLKRTAKAVYADVAFRPPYPCGLRNMI